MLLHANANLFGGKSLLRPSFIPTFVAFSCRLSSLFILSLVVWQPLVFHPNSKSCFQIALLLKNHNVRFMYLHQKPFLRFSWQTWRSEISACTRIIPKLLWAMLRDSQLPPCHSWALKRTELKESIWLCGRNSCRKQEGWGTVFPQFYPRINSLTWMESPWSRIKIHSDKSGPLIHWQCPCRTFLSSQPTEHCCKHYLPKHCAMPFPQTNCFLTQQRLISMLPA